MSLFGFFFIFAVISMVLKVSSISSSKEKQRRMKPASAGARMRPHGGEQIDNLLHLTRGDEDRIEQETGERSSPQNFLERSSSQNFLDRSSRDRSQKVKPIRSTHPDSNSVVKSGSVSGSLYDELDAIFKPHSNRLDLEKAGLKKGSLENINLDKLHLDQASLATWRQAIIMAEILARPKGDRS